MSELKRPYPYEQWSDKPVYPPISIQGVHMALLPNGDVEAHATGTKPKKVGRLQSEDGTAWVPKHKNANSMLKWMARDGCIDHLIAHRREQLDRRRRIRDAAPELLEALEGLWGVVEGAIQSGDWQVDGACDPDAELHRAERVIKKAKGES